MMLTGGLVLLQHVLLFAFDQVDDGTGLVAFADPELAAEVAGLVFDRPRRKHPATITIGEDLEVLSPASLEDLHALG